MWDRLSWSSYRVIIACEFALADSPSVVLDKWLLGQVWLYFHILTIYHCEIKLFSICTNLGPVCIDYITNVLINYIIAKGFGSKLAKN